MTVTQRHGVSASPTPKAVASGAAVSPSGGGPGVFGPGNELTLVALDTIKVPVVKNRSVTCVFSDSATLRSTARYDYRSLKKGRWHRAADRIPQTDNYMTACGRKIPGQRLAVATYYVPPHRGPNPQEVERDRLCARCFC